MHRYIIVFFILTGCTNLCPNSRFPITIETNISDEDIDLIDQAERIWLTEIDKYVENFDLITIVRASGDINLESDDDFNDDHLGIAYTTQIGHYLYHCNVEVDYTTGLDDATEETTVVVIAHELGHCFGIAEHDDPVFYPNSIMDAINRTNDVVVYPHHVEHILKCDEEN